MTYNVFSGTLNPTQPQPISYLPEYGPTCSISRPEVVGGDQTWV